MHTIGQPFILLDSTESTNIHAMAEAHARLAGHGTAFFAQEQTSGKGQRGKSWLSEPGKNIILSVVLQPREMNPADVFPLHLISALACFDLFNKYAGGETAIKWPNDLYWRDRKAGGILIENAVLGNRVEFSIVGMGININQTLFPEQLVNPVSLRQITGKTHAAPEMARELCGLLDKRYSQFLKTGMDQLLVEYNQHLFARGRQVWLKTGNIRSKWVVKGVDRNGLLLAEAVGEKRSFAFGEVEWMETLMD